MPSPIRRLTQALVALALIAGISLQGIGPASAAVPVVGLGVAQSYAVLAGTPSITNTGPTVVSGDLGIAPAASIIGFGGPPNGSVSGAIQPPNIANAKADLTTAYLDAAARVDTQPVLGASLDGQTLIPGVYSGGALGLPAAGTVTLDGQGDPGAVFIIRAASTLITLAGSTVVLTGAAQACNVFWQVTSSATFGTNSTFVGTVMALTDISALTGATISGRLLARNGQVTLQSNTINRPACAAPPTVFAPGPTTSSTTSSTSTSTTSTTSPATTTTVRSSASTLPVSSTGGPVAPIGGSGSGAAVPTPGEDSSIDTSTLPRTGDDPRQAIAYGGLAILSGTVLVGAARRRGAHAAR